MPAAVRHLSQFRSTTSTNDTPPGITDKVAKESSDSNASSHPLQYVFVPHNSRTHTLTSYPSDDKNADAATSGGNAHANAHKANPVRTSPGWFEGLRWKLTTRQGPVHADNLPTKETKEDLKKRAEELNK